jgi:hypothetical protein
LAASPALLHARSRPASPLAVACFAPLSPLSLALALSFAPLRSFLARFALPLMLEGAQALPAVLASRITTEHQHQHRFGMLTG